jgi:cytochrome c-type biogenesis protein
MPDLGHLLILAVGLGLLGFIEPCSVGAHLLFLKLIEGRPRAAKLRQVAIFASIRALFIGSLGALAALLGQSLFALQRGGWLALGVLYTALGVLYLTGKATLLMRRLGPAVSRLSDGRASATLGLLFGLNIPACAAPLLLAILGAVAIEGGTLGAPLVQGFAILATFGLALSLPVAVLVVWHWAAIRLDRIMARAGALPIVTGLVLLALGLWSIYFAWSVARPG